MGFKEWFVKKVHNHNIKIDKINEQKARERGIRDTYYNIAREESIKKKAVEDGVKSVYNSEGVVRIGRFQFEPWKMLKKMTEGDDDV